MANNPYANKVIYGNQTIMDLSEDTVVASDVLQGKTFHDATGALLTGTYTPSASGYTIHIFTEDSNLFGNTITISKDDVVLGTTTFDNTGNATFDVQQKGVYVASTTYQGTVYQKSVDVTDEFLVELSEVVDGKTALPTDDIQIWLKCAGINDKSYTTLAEVLADTDTLLALINSNNAVDYMVRSKTWVGVPLVPVMTSNNTPSGVCTVWQYFQGDAYLVFDGDDTTCSRCAQLTSGSGFGYQFATAQRVAKVKGTAMLNAATGAVRTEKIQYSDDGVTWNDSDTFTINESNGTPVTQSEYAFPFSQTVSEVNAHEYWRIYLTNASAVTRNGFWTIQFYSENLCDNLTAMQYIGQNNYCANTLLSDTTWLEAICNSEYFESVLNVKTPKMTSNTTPSGECFGYGAVSENPYYYAFDGNDSTSFRTNAEVLDANVGYEFTEQTRICMCKALIGTNTTAESHYTFKVQGSTDRFSFDVTDLSEAFNITLANQGTASVTKIFNTIKSSFRLFSTAQLETNRRMVIFTLQFYGREDVVEPEPSTEMVLYENGTQYVELSNRMSGITNSAVFQSSYIQCSYYSTNACGFSSVNGIDVEGYKSLKVRFKLANNDSYVKVIAADLETNFLNKGINSVKLGFGYRGNVATLYLKDAQYSVTTSDYWASTVSGGNNYIAVDKIWLE